MRRKSSWGGDSRIPRRDPPHGTVSGADALAHSTEQELGMLATPADPSHRIEGVLLGRALAQHRVEFEGLGRRGAAARGTRGRDVESAGGGAYGRGALRTAVTRAQRPHAHHHLGVTMKGGQKATREC